MQSIHQLQTKDIKNKDFNFADLKGKVILITNIALKCGTTPQLKELQELQDKFKDRGLVVLGVPANDFTKESIQSDKISSTCNVNFGTKFTLLQPCRCTGANKSELFQFLTSQSSKENRGEVSFNFEKFLIDKNGFLRARFGSFTGALSENLIENVEKLLNE